MLKSSLANFLTLAISLTSGAGASRTAPAAALLTAPNKRNKLKAPSKPIQHAALLKAVKVAADSSTARLRAELMSLIVEQVNQHGLNFLPTAEETAALRQAGASDELLATLQRKAQERAALLEQQEWQACQANRQPAAWQAFLAQYPASQHADVARAQLAEWHWEKIQESEQPEDFTQFLAANADGDKAALAHARLDLLAWRKAQAGGQAADFTDFLNSYPQSQYAASAQQRLAQGAWEDIKASREPAAFAAFVEQHPSGPLADAARIRLDQLRWEATLAGGKLKDFEQYLRQYPDGHFAAAARERVDRLTSPAKHIKKSEDAATSKSSGKVR